MQDKEQVFLYMKEEIERLARVKEEEILQETKELEDKAYQQIKEEVKKDAERQLEKELTKISLEASNERANISELKNKELVNKRDKYVEDIFKEAKDKLVTFVDGKEYQQYMINRMVDISKKYQMEQSVLFLRNEDLSLKDKLIEAYGIDIDVTVSDKINIGGFIIENRGTSVVIDESLDFALENQKEWFYKTSGLMIK